MAAARARLLEVGVRRFGDGRVDEDQAQQGVEDGDAEVAPLHVDEAAAVLHAAEEGLAREQGEEHGGRGLHALADVEPDLGEARRAAQRDERVAAQLEDGDAAAHDQVGHDEGRVGEEHGRGPEDERAKAVEGEARDEGGLEAVGAEDVVADGHGRTGGSQ